MCQKKPLPRCSDHVKSRLVSVINQQSVVREKIKELDATRDTHVPHQKMTLYTLAQEAKTLAKKREELEREYKSTPAGQSELEDHANQIAGFLGTDSEEYQTAERELKEARQLRRELLTGAKTQIRDLEKTQEFISDVPGAAKLTKQIRDSYNKVEKLRADLPEEYTVANLTAKQKTTRNQLIHEQRANALQLMELSQRIVDKKGGLLPDGTYGVFQNHEGDVYLSKAVVDPKRTTLMHFENGKTNTVPEGWDPTGGASTLIVARGNRPYSTTAKLNDPYFAQCAHEQIWDNNPEGAQAVSNQNWDAIRAISSNTKTAMKKVKDTPGITAEEIIQAVDTTAKNTTVDGVPQKEMDDAREAYLSAYRWSIHNITAPRYK